MNRWSTTRWTRRRSGLNSAAAASVATATATGALTGSALVAQQHQPGEHPGQHRGDDEVGAAYYPRFANARSVRNAIDRMRLRQANRLVAAGALVGRDDPIRLEPADITVSRIFGTGP